MFRISLIVCISLIFGVTAKPYKPWNKLTHEAFQDTVMSVDATGKMSLKVEVEPPEDMDETQYVIDPNMMIWKKMTGTGQEKQPLKPEEDLDELHHPSVADLLKVQTHNLDALPAADVQSEPSQENANTGYNHTPEEDRDDIDHPVFRNVALEEPEQDWDEIYHKANEELDAYLAPLVAEYKSGTEHRAPYPELSKLLRREVRVHLQPEEDMDDLYHADVQQPIPHQGDAKAAAPADQPSQRKYSEPEEDLDDLYHL